MKNYMNKVLEHFDSQVDLSKQLKVTPAYVGKMVKTGHVPAEQCKKIEALTNGEVTAVQLRPDIFSDVVVAASVA